jgi:hypothetical protein
MVPGNWRCPSEWSEWSEWLAAGLHARNRWRLPVLLAGILFAVGRRTVSSWLRAAGVSTDFQDYYYFLAPSDARPVRWPHSFFCCCCSDCPCPIGCWWSSTTRPPSATAQGRRGRHSSQSHARSRRPEVPLWTHLGHALPGAATSVVGRAGAAAAGHALRPPEDASHHSPATRLAVSDQARTRCPVGCVDRGAGETGGKTGGWWWTAVIPRSPS